MRLIDTHSHLFLEEFSEDFPQVIERARAAGVTHIFMPNIDSTTIEAMLSACSVYKGYCFPMIGLHPTSVNANYEKELEIVARELKFSKEYVAIGEIGMDLYWDKTYLKEQQIVLDKQVNWALEYDLPIVIHCRDAFDYIYKVYSIALQERQKKLPVYWSFPISSLELTVWLLLRNPTFRKFWQEYH